MIVVIQCAAQKQPEAGFLRTRAGKKVLFVANPAAAPLARGLIFAHPDDLSDTGLSWREMLLLYNRTPSDNPLRLLPAAHLYTNRTYGQLVKRFGCEKVYILSAGWGLIKASFLTPNYDITFSMTAEPYKRRRKGDPYRDMCMLQEDTSEPIVFFGGKDYLPLFCLLTKNVKGQRTVFYNSSHAPAANGCSLVRFVTTTRTNWHYECVKDFLDRPQM